MTAILILTTLLHALTCTHTHAPTIFISSMLYFPHQATLEEVWNGEIGGEKTESHLTENCSYDKCKFVFPIRNVLFQNFW